MQGAFPWSQNPGRDMPKGILTLSICTGTVYFVCTCYDGCKSFHLQRSGWDLLVVVILTYGSWQMYRRVSGRLSLAQQSNYCSHSGRLYVCNIGNADGAKRGILQHEPRYSEMKVFSEIHKHQDAQQNNLVSWYWWSLFVGLYTRKEIRWNRPVSEPYLLFILVRIGILGNEEIITDAPRASETTVALRAWLWVQVITCLYMMIYPPADTMPIRLIIWMISVWYLPDLWWPKAN